MFLQTLVQTSRQKPRKVWVNRNGSKAFPFIEAIWVASICLVSFWLKYKYILVRRVWTRTYTYIYIYTYMYIYIHTYMYIYIYVYIRTPISKCVCLHANLHTPHVCVYVIIVIMWYYNCVYLCIDSFSLLAVYSSSDVALIV